MTKTNLIGSEKSLGKKVLSVFLAFVMLLGTMAVGTVFLPFMSSAAEVKNPITMGDLTFVVPEVIYLYPDAKSSQNTSSTPFQFFVNNNRDGSVTSTTDTSGYIYYSLSGAGNATISGQFWNEELTSTLSGTIPLSSSTISNGGSVTVNRGGSMSPSLTSSTNGCYILWTLSYTDPADGRAKKAYAYTYVYKPYTVPVATGTDAGTGTSSGANWAGSITWISGFHSLTAGGKNSYNDWDNDYYGYTNLTNFSAFISKEPTGYVGSTAVTGSNDRKNERGQQSFDAWDDNATVWYTVFSNSSAQGYYLQVAENSNPSYIYSASSSSNTSSVANFMGGKYRSNTKNVQATLYNASYGNLYIDTSRYSNLKDIPNLGVGMLVSDDERSANTSGGWYIADFTDRSTEGYNTWHKDSDKGDTYYADHGDLIAQQGTGRASLPSDEREGIRYAGAWPKALLGSTSSTSGATYDYMIKSAYGNKDSSIAGSYYAWSHNVCKLHTIYYNKGTLRTAVQRAIKAFPALGVTGMSGTNITSCYFDADTNYKWTAFQSAFTAAYKALTQLNNTSNMQTLADNLNNALNALCTKITIDPNGGTYNNSSATSTVYTTIGTNQTVAYTPTGSTARTGYTFAGWALSANADPSTAVSTITVGYNNTVYAIWKINTYTVTFKAEDGSVIKTETVNHGADATPPAAQTKASDATYHYNFNGWSGYTNITADTTVQASFTAVKHTEVTDAAVPATCTSSGSTEGKHCSVCGYVITAQEPVGAKGHNYGTPTYEWAADNSSVTATALCENDNSHVETETAKANYTVTTPATCEKDGVGTYTASFTNTRFTTQTKEVKINAINHNYNFDSFVWSDGNTKAQAKLICANDASHIIYEDAVMTSSTTPATCTDDEYTVYTATYGANTESRTVTDTGSATGHDYKFDSFVWSSDNTTAQAKLVCVNEASHIKYEDAAMSSDIHPATCTENAYTVYTATYDGNTDSKTVIYDGTATEHNYVDVVTDPTCTEDGYTTHTCVRGDHSYVDSYVDALGHEYEVEVTDPTCTEDGYTTYICKRGDDSYIDDHVDALGHEYEVEVTDPTCTAQGYTTHTCIRGDDSFVDTYVDATGHDYKFNSFIWSDGNTKAQVKLICENDDSHIIYEDAAITSSTISATCTEDAYTVYTATYGDNTDSRTVTHEGSKLEHSFTVYTPNGDAACTNDGTKTAYCDYDCGTANTVTDEGSKLGHDFDDTIKANVTVKEAACTENGSKTVKCSRCDEVEETVLVAVGHKEKEAVTESYVAATCTSEGSYYSVIYCAVCSEELSRKETVLPIDENAHVWGEWTVSKPATCTEAGEQTRFCAENEEHRETKVIPELGHNWGEWITVTEATSSSDGLERRTCLRCNETEERKVQLASEKTRQIQFVVADNMYYVVHLEEVDYYIYSKTTKAIYWYNNRDLNFEVVTGIGWKYDSYNVRVDGVTLEPNADGTFTLPGGTGYTQINIYPVSDNMSNLTENGVCKYCGKVHPNHIWGRLVALFHSIFYFIKNLFSR